jgi:hypothetical protein
VSEAYAAIATSAQGLTANEAVDRLRQYGANALQTVKGQPLALRLLGNFTRLTALLLWPAG